MSTISNPATTCSSATILSGSAPARPIPAHLRENAYQAWLHTKVDRVSEIIQRKQGQTDFEGMPRLQRVLRDVLYAVGIAVDALGKHLPLSEALVVLDPDHPRHREVYGHVDAHLPPEVLADLARILSYRRPEDRLKETESTLNRLRSLFSPILQAIFSRQEHTIDVRRIIQSRHILLVNLRETDYFSADQANALGGLFIHQVLSTAATTERDLRTPFYLLIDEAARFVGDDLQRALGECRKYKLSVVLAAQDLSSFKKKDFDMSQKVLSQCRSQICFQQQHPDDLDVLARVLGTGNLDFTEHQQVMDRPDGYDWIELEETSEGRSTSQTWNESRSESESDSVSRQETRSHSTQTNWQESRSRSTSTGRSGAESTGRSPSRPPHESRSHGNTRSESHGESRSTGGGEGFSEGESEGTSQTTGRSASTGKGGTEGESRTTSHRKTPLARHREEWHATGKLTRSVNDQFQRIMQLLHALPTRCALVKLVDVPEAFPIQVGDVAEPFASPRVKAHVVARFKQALYDTHPYFFRPTFGPAEQDRASASSSAHAQRNGSSNGTGRTRPIRSRTNLADAPIDNSSCSVTNLMSAHFTS